MADNTEILITEIMGHPYADWQALLETLREHYDVRSPAEGTTVVRRQAEALHRMNKCNARQVERIAALEAEVETMRVAAHELTVERDDARSSRRDSTQEEDAARSAYNAAAATARAANAAADAAAAANAARDAAAAAYRAADAYNAARKEEE